MLLLTMLVIFFSSLISCPWVRKVYACLPMLKISAVTELPEQLGTARPVPFSLIFLLLSLCTPVCWELFINSDGCESGEVLYSLSPFKLLESRWKVRLAKGCPRLWEKISVHSGRSVWCWKMFLRSRLLFGKCWGNAEEVITCMYLENKSRLFFICGVRTARKY